MQSNSVYVSMLKIPIVHADCVSKLLCQKFFFSHKQSLLAQGKIIYFATKMDTNWDSAHQSQNEDNFPTFSLGLEFLNRAEKEKNNGKGDSASAPSQLLHCPTSYVIKQLVHAFSRALSSYGAHGKFGEHSRSIRVTRGNSRGQL